MKVAPEESTIGPTSVPSTAVNTRMISQILVSPERLLPCRQWSQRPSQLPIDVQDNMDLERTFHESLNGEEPFRNNKTPGIPGGAGRGSVESLAESGREEYRKEDIKNSKESEGETEGFPKRWRPQVAEDRRGRDLERGCRVASMKDTEGNFQSLVL